MRRFATIVLAGILSLSVSLSLSSCFPSPKQIVEEALKQAGGGSVDLSGNGQLPEGFPPEVPIVDGELISGIGIAGGWNVTVRLPGDPAALFAEVGAELADAGFAQGAGGGHAGAYGGTYQGDAHVVVVGITADGANSLVNYTVTNSAR